MINFFKINRVLILITVILITSCKSKKVSCVSENIEEITFYNKAKYFYGGLDQKKIFDKKQINKICRKINNLKYEQVNAVINANYGYVEVVDSNQNLFDIIFSEYDGPVVQFNGKSYKNDKLVRLISDELNMDYELIMNQELSENYLSDSKYKGKKKMTNRKLVREVKKDSI